jgi:prophage DNA circulation protein
MSWRDSLQKGKFRDAEFYTEASDGSIGRRTEVHEYPLRDKPFVDDLGRRARQITLDAYVLGPDYMAARDRLIEALEKPGPGPLTHHWMGLMQVAVVGEVGISESTREGGMCRFRITFVEAGENKFPTALSDTRTLVDAQADAGLLAEIDTFADLFSLDGVASFVSTAAQTIASGGIDQLMSIAGTYFGGVGLSAFLVSALSLKSSVTSLLASPASFASRWTSLLGSLIDIDGDPGRGVKAYRGLTGYGATLPAISQTTAQRKIQSANQTALLGLIRRSALIEEARTTRLRSFPSYNEAAAVREDLADRLDAEMETAPDNVYLALQGLRSATVKDITARSADLSRVIQYTPKATLPALVVAHQIYGDATKADELITRNRSIRHPGFVPGNRALEVLSV